MALQKKQIKATLVQTGACARPLSPKAQRAARREMIVQRWGLSTHRPRPTPEECLMRARTEAFCCACIEALRRGGDDARGIAALAEAAVREWDILWAQLVEEIAEPRAYVWRYEPGRNGRAIIERAVEILAPSEEHRKQARIKFALTALAPSFEAYPSVAFLRLAVGVPDKGRIRIDQVVRALVEALTTDNARRLGCPVVEPRVLN
jgi:hypothetical protein